MAPAIAASSTAAAMPVTSWQTSRRTTARRSMSHDILAMRRSTEGSCPQRLRKETSPSGLMEYWPV